MTDAPLTDLRREYESRPLHRKDLADDPIEQFREWFQAVLKLDLPDPNAMFLATATPTGSPSIRTVLLKDFNGEGFVFFTNYESRKGIELAANPRASLLFYWAAFNRQVRIEGPVERVPRSVSEDYFARRPYRSRIAAFVSRQSHKIDSRGELEKQVREAETRFRPDTLPTPEQWGGYRLEPEQFEFWQGQRDRLHDRFLYQRDGERWTIQRLAP